MPTYLVSTSLIPIASHLVVTIWSVIIGALFLFGWMCAAKDLQPLQKLVNDAVLECLMLSQITPKEAATLCGMSEGNFYRALSGEEYRNISLVALCALPYRFWLHFGPMLMWMVAKKNWHETILVGAEFAEDVRNLRRRA